MKKTLQMYTTFKINKTDQTKAEVLKPSPRNFDEYVHWACRQMQVDAEIVMDRIQPKIETLSGRSRSKSKAKDTPIEPKEEVRTNLTTSTSLTTIAGYEVVKIITTYDHTGNLIQIKFDKNKHIARNVLKIIEHILHFHRHITKVSINRGLTNAILNDLNKWLYLSNITNICLDNAELSDGSYEILLNGDGLRQLSLARCGINDKIIKNIASKLPYPLPASKTLSVFNLTSNKITDAGAKYIAEALRSNRKLAYLNLSDNLITDKGAAVLFDVLIKFTLFEKEFVSFRSSLRTSLKRDKKINSEGEVHDRNPNQTFLKQRPRSTSAVIKAKIRSASNTDISGLSLKTIEKQRKSQVNLRKTSYDKEKVTVESGSEVTEDPFSHQNIVFRNNQGFCLGNNYLAYLNISYNDLSYISVKHILNVLIYQKRLDRIPRGLVKICIEGNYMPVNCDELRKIDQILNDNIQIYSKK